MDISCSVFKHVTDTANPYHRSVFQLLTRVKTGRSKELVEKYRTTKDDKYKRSLPGYCFSGTFSNRSESGLIQHSGLIVLDFDKVDDAEAMRDSLSDISYTFAAFISPSGEGVKVLFRIPPEPENHREYFGAIELYFAEQGLTVDPSGKDVSRFCFESWDEGLYLNQNAEVWSERIIEEYDQIGKYTDEVVIPMTSDNQIIRNLQQWFDKKYGMNKGSRNDNLFKFAAALNDFGINQNVSEAHLIQYAAKDFNEREVLAVVKSAYKRGVTNFATKSFEDGQLRTKIEKKIRSGAKESDVKKFITKEAPNLQADIGEILTDVKGTMDVDEFWRYDENGSVKLVPHKYKFYLEGNNFMKFYPTNSDTFVFIRKEQNLIEETNEQKIKDFVMNDLMNRDSIGFKPYDYMASSTRFFTPAYLNFLNPADIIIQEDNREECYLYYQNCAVKVTTTGLEQIDYLDLSGYVWRNQIIAREFVPTDHHESEFRTFLWKIAGEDEERYNSFKSIVGYLLHSYKTSANNKAIILNDETISENPNGGSGKGLFWNAIAKMKKVSMIDGKTFDFNKSFPYQTVSTDCQVLVFDDVKKNFSFESLFSVITEGITIEYKGQDAIKIPVEKSPKILITTNYTVGGVGGSFERRKFEAELSAYFGAHHTPEDEFGHMLFDDWTEKEWSRFDAFMINCIQYYLEKGLVKHEFKNLATRKFIKDTSSEFYEWSKEEGVITFNTRIGKRQLYDNFVDDYPDMKKWLTQKRFKLWIHHYAKFYGFEFLEGNSQGMRWVEITNLNHKKEEECPF